jgi:PadR family transcriptional regulator
MPGEFEQVVLLALAGLEGAATGREVYEHLTEMTRREVSVAAIHITLSRATEKGWVLCETSDPEPGQGGKPRKHYSLASSGAEVLSRQRSQLDRLWGQATRNPLLDGGQG